MFWIKTQFGELLNLADMQNIYIEEEKTYQVKNPFRVRALTNLPAEWWHLLAEFETKEDAQNYLDKIFELLNGRVVYNG